MPIYVVVCRFCGEPRAATDWYHVQCADARTVGPRENAFVPVCTTHARLLRAAGVRGRVYGPAGLRWWLTAE
jgi:hypothetical protein